jgi:hypothetical protein
MSTIFDFKTLRDATGNAITLARLICNYLRAIYEEAMVLYIKHSHNNLMADIYRGDPVYMVAIYVPHHLFARRKLLRPHAMVHVAVHLLLIAWALTMDAVTVSHV